MQSIKYEVMMEGNHPLENMYAKAGVLDKTPLRHIE